MEKRRSGRLLLALLAGSCAGLAHAAAGNAPPARELEPGGESAYAECGGTIGGRVWLDRNKDGLQGNPLFEPGIAGAMVSLRSTGPDGNLRTGDDETETAATDASGAYAFAGKCRGTYSVSVAMPSGLSPTLIHAGANRAVDSADPRGPAGDNVVLASDEAIEDREPTEKRDFGLVAACRLEIAGWVWNDVNQDGVQDQGEGGVANVTVKLFDALAEAPLKQVKSAADGRYSFKELCPAPLSYRVEAAPKGMVPSPLNVGDAVRDSDGFPTNAPGEPGVSSATATMAPGTRGQVLDFGFYKGDGGR